ncbi:hypothetical protein FRC18_010376 [Serendipita sp. 400]|nr:hypothetical protein FRC18_010376 [Serendipita sp. 400]
MKAFEHYFTTRVSTTHFQVAAAPLKDANGKKIRGLNIRGVALDSPEYNRIAVWKLYQLDHFEPPNGRKVKRSSVQVLDDNRVVLFITLAGGLGDPGMAAISSPRKCFETIQDPASCETTRIGGFATSDKVFVDA